MTLQLCLWTGTGQSGRERQQHSFLLLLQSLGGLWLASLSPGGHSETRVLPRALGLFLHQHLSFSPKRLQARGTHSQPEDQRHQ